MEDSSLNAPIESDTSSSRSNDAVEGSPFDDIELRVESSEPFVGKWNQLVSQTNWEKGAIILEWRQALLAENAPATSYSDEAWSRLVGGVTSQHVGRLRRVYQHFGDQRETYNGLYWSHFQAALDWDDAELWLEGAVQNGWSISQMRNQRWETHGADPSVKPDERDIVTADIDEDYEPLRSQMDSVDQSRDSSGPENAGPRHEGPDFGEDSDQMGAQLASSVGDPGESIYSEIGEDGQAIDFVRPFENLAELPDDVAEAFDSFKLAIIRHKNAGWDDISQADMLGCLDALKELAKLPASD